jgi:hypothetical protein
MSTENVSGLDDLFYDVTLTDASTGTALTAGTVTVALCTARTTTPLGNTATVTLTHVANGRWTGVHDGADVASAISALPLGGAFDRVLFVAGAATRRLATCRRVTVVEHAP